MAKGKEDITTRLLVVGGGHLVVMQVRVPILAVLRFELPLILATFRGMPTANAEG